MSVVFFIMAQIICEAFPISSSGHVTLLENLFRAVSFDAKEALDFFAHGPTAIIILIFFIKSWWPVLFRIFSHYSYRDSYKRLWKIIFKIIFFVSVSTVFITAGLFFPLKKILQNYSLFKSPLFLFVGFVITSVSLFSLYIKNRFYSDEYCEKWDFKKAIILGFIQGTAWLIPGVSRLATTYVAGRWLKLSPRRSFQISFLIQFFLIAAAGVKGFFDLSVSSYSFVLHDLNFWGSVVIASVLAYAGLHFVWLAIKYKKIWWFGFYELIPAVLVFVLLK
jgi:undecaprenyl pyrophosphate phosphatase UppP